MLRRRRETETHTLTTPTTRKPLERMTDPGEMFPPKEEEFGVFTDATGSTHTVKRFTFANKNGLTAQVIDFGVTLVSVRAPDRSGNMEDVALGFDTFDDYIKYQSAYMGSTIGRVCNRVSTGRFTLAGRTYQLTKNVKGAWQLHGGFTGLSFVVWNSHVEGDRVVFSRLSPDGEEGFPGNLLLQVVVCLTDRNEVRFSCRAMTDKSTPVSLTNHAYFNLAGHGTGYRGLGEHMIVLNADQYLVCSEEMVPTGETKRVGVPAYFDLRVPKLLSDLIPQVPMGGYDQNYRINGSKEEGVRFVARLVHPQTGRVLDVLSDQPCCVLYTSRNLPRPGDTTATLVVGKGGVHYQQYGAICIEPQAYPDAVNKPHFPPVILDPGQVYGNEMVFRFLVDEDAPPVPSAAGDPGRRSE